MDKIKIVVYNILLCVLFVVYFVYNPIRAFFVRRKKKISVAFIIDNIAKWKTEPLFFSMVKHQRFNPIVLVRNNYESICPILEDKKIEYYKISESESIWKKYHPDLTFYQEPYGVGIIRNLFSLFCWQSYSLHIENASSLTNPYCNVCWRIFFMAEHEMSVARNCLLGKGYNCRKTGQAMVDEYLQWLKKDRKNRTRKRIIWTPHHTIPGGETTWAYSTFLSYSDYMKEIALKYSNIEFVFKPHPSLFYKLCYIWGEERTKSYYDWWQQQENTSLFHGQYMDLFFNSDAILNDSVSFTEEWLFTKNPGLHLFRKDARDEGVSQMRKDALLTYYQAYNEQDIENFIVDVLINGNDPLKEKREAFFNQYYAQKDSMTNCDRIIKEILGEKY